MRREFEEIADVLRWLTSDGLVEDPDEVAAGVVRSDVAARLGYFDAKTEDLPRRMKEPKGEAGPFLLRAVRDTVPVLRLRWDWTESSPVLRLRLAMFFAGEGDPGRELLAVGYRLETPESTPDHAMHHIQPISSLDGAGGELLPGISQKWPEDVPTFPLAASSALELVICLVASVYGAFTVRDRINGQLGQIAAGYLESLVSPS
jgi:hypothetical protein